MSRVLVSLLFVSIAVVACSGDDVAGSTEAAPSTSTTIRADIGASPPRIDGADLADVVDRVAGVARAHGDAWNRQDVDAILSFYDDESVHDDSLFGVVLQGDPLYEMPAGFVAEFSDVWFELADIYVNREAALLADRVWGVTLRGVTYTKEEPMLEMDRVEVGEDGLIGRWSLYYGLEMWESWDSPGFRMEAARSLLDRHLAAWGGADPEAVGALYSARAERVDTLLGTSASGPNAIAAVAEDLYARHPVLVWTPGFEFSDSRKAASDIDVVGSVYRLHLPEGCVVRMAVLLTAADGIIEREEVFWDADSLLACGWAA